MLKRCISFSLCALVLGCFVSLSGAQESITKEKGPFEGEHRPVTKGKAQEEVKKEEQESGERESRQEKAKRLVGSEHFDLFWEDGLHFYTKGENIRVRVGGWIMTDWGYVSEDRIKRSGGGAGSIVGEDEWEIDLREARLITRGTIYDFAEFQIEPEFSEHEPDWKDVFIKFLDLSYLGSAAFGHMKEPFSLEELIRFNNITFMERSLPNALVPGRNTGVELSNSAFDRLTWAIGGFWETEDLDSEYSESGPINLTARMTGLPWYDNEWGGLLHLGFSYSRKFMRDGGTMSFSTSPESVLTDTSLNTGRIPAEGADLFSLEAASVLRSFSVQGEYMQALVDSPRRDDPRFNGWYIYGSYFLTGEQRVYDTSKGTFGFLTPNRPFTPARGKWGALEAALRYSHIDLNDGRVRGGKADDLTTGLNWYLSSNIRFMVNYIHSDMDRDRDADIIQFRLQIHFDSPAPFDVPSPSKSPAS